MSTCAPATTWSGMRSRWQTLPSSPPCTRPCQPSPRSRSNSTSTSCAGELTHLETLHELCHCNLCTAAAHCGCSVRLMDLQLLLLGDHRHQTLFVVDKPNALPCCCCRRFDHIQHTADTHNTHSKVAVRKPAFSPPPPPAAPAKVLHPPVVCHAEPQLGGAHSNNLSCKRPGRRSAGTS